uniref:Uncharacterized protein n=1 Tax=Zea mays TaxID=4577 RepID=C0P3W8_MAIZE|nr:unknown [Zea mays]
MASSLIAIEHTRFILQFAATLHMLINRVCILPDDNTDVGSNVVAMAFPNLINLLYCYCPSLAVLGGHAHLNGCQRRVQLLRHRVRPRSELIPLALVRDCRHGSNHHRGPGAEHLVCGHQIVDGNQAFLNLVSAVPGELDDALARDARQDGAPGVRRGDHAALDDEHVARRHLLQVPLVDRVQVQHVREPLALGVHLRPQHRRVVGDGLDPAGAAGHRAVELVMHHQVDGRQALLEVVPNGCGVDEEGVLGGRSQPKDRAAPHEQRPEVQGSLPLRRHPAPVGEDCLPDGVDELLHRRRRHAHALGAALHPPRVLLRPEQRVPGPVRPPVRLHSLEQALGVV